MTKDKNEEYMAKLAGELLDSSADVAKAAKAAFLKEWPCQHLFR